MRKLFSISFAFILFSIAFISWTNNKADSRKSYDDCTVKGVFTGEAKSSGGVTSQMTYDFRDNNLAIGMSSPTGSAVTFGGYKASCDSVYISVCYTGNMSYYLLKGKFSEDHNIITGTYQNKVTISDKGTFSISRL